MPIVAIVHPRRAKHPAWVELQKILVDQGQELEIHLSEWSGHSRELACQHCPKEGTVIAVGGDGTFHEVVNGWMEQPERGEPNFVLVPMGTGNDFARDQGLRANPMELAAAVLRPEVKTIDLAKLSYLGEEGPATCYSLAAATVGFSAEVVRYFQTLPRFLPGTVQYLFATVVSLFRWSNGRASIWIDDEVHESSRFFNLNVANTRYYGGGMYASPRAVADSGQLETVLMELTRWEVIKASPRNYNGNFEGVNGVTQQSATSIKVESPLALPVQADGEFLGVTPLEITVCPKVMRLALPGLETGWASA